MTQTCLRHRKSGYDTFGAMSCEAVTTLTTCRQPKVNSALNGDCLFLKSHELQDVTTSAARGTHRFHLLGELLVYLANSSSQTASPAIPDLLLCTRTILLGRLTLYFVRCLTLTYSALGFLAARRHGALHLMRFRCLAEKSR